MSSGIQTQLGGRGVIPVIYGVVVGLLLLELSLVIIAPFADQAWYPLVAVVPGPYKTVYPGPLLVAIAMALGLASAFIVPRRYYGVFVVVLIIAAVIATAIVGYVASCAVCKWVICQHVQSCGIDVGLFTVKVICTCQ